MDRAARPGGFWTLALILGAGLALLQFAGRVVLWFAPYHLAGLINELGLLALGLASGGLISLALAKSRIWRGPAWRAGLTAGLLLYAGASFAMLGWSAQTGIGLGVHRYTLFSAPGCEFAARFPGPPNSGRLRGDVFERRPDDAPAAAVAVYADLESLTALRADCLRLATAGAQDPAALAAAAARQWAAHIGMQVREERLERRGPDAVFSLRGSVGGSVLPDAAGGSGRTLAAIDSHIGRRSIMTVYAFHPDGGSLSPLAQAFLDGVRRR
ncbi:MAG: hypothetical protein AB7R90_10765 [Reyranellaceae bacterium]